MMKTRLRQVDLTPRGYKLKSTAMRVCQHVHEQAIFDIAELIVNGVAVSEARFRACLVADDAGVHGTQRMEAGAFGVVRLLGENNDPPHPGYAEAIVDLSEELDRVTVFFAADDGKRPDTSRRHAGGAVHGQRCNSDLPGYRRGGRPLASVRPGLEGTGFLAPPKREPLVVPSKRRLPEPLGAHSIDCALDGPPPGHLVDQSSDVRSHAGIWALGQNHSNAAYLHTALATLPTVRP